MVTDNQQGQCQMRPFIDAIADPHSCWLSTVEALSLASVVELLTPPSFSGTAAFPSLVILQRIEYTPSAVFTMKSVNISVIGADVILSTMASTLSMTVSSLL